MLTRFTLGALLLGSLATASETNLLERGVILRLMHRANDWQVAHPVMKPNSRTWIRGTWYTGVMAAYKTTGDDRFLKQTLDWGRQHDWQVGNERSGGNKLFCVETWAELSLIKHDKALIAPAIEWLGSAASNTPTGAKVWYLEGGRRYADALYGASALAMLAKATGERKYLDWMNAFFWDVHAEAFDKDTGLFYRDKRFIGQTTKNGKKILWSRGKGWVFGGLARILEYLPEDDPERARYVELFKTMAAAIAKRQGTDGLWRPNLDDPEDQPMPETSGTGFFCYGLAWGLNHGVLDRATYLPVAQKAWAGLVKCLGDDGKVQWGQLVGDRPVEVKQDDTHEYVTGTFLLAAGEMYRLAPPGNKKE
ncbi:MAG: glycoside hydrolase family 88 protein [Kiritimatiellaeota bacterium]|nr:glycoside hydrolase family 88 protein [Kiritimatiellota bacterium]